MVLFDFNSKNMLYSHSHDDARGPEFSRRLPRAFGAHALSARPVVLANARRGNSDLAAEPRAILARSEPLEFL